MTYTTRTHFGLVTKKMKLSKWVSEFKYSLGFNVMKKLVAYKERQHNEILARI